MNKITGIVISIVVVAALGYGFYVYAPAQDSLEQDIAERGGENRFEWTFESKGENAEGMPSTEVALWRGDSIYPAGTYAGSCSIIEESAWELVEGELTGVICWFAGGGNEIGVFEENGTYAVKVGDLDEGSAEEPGFRGNFRTLFTI